MLQAVANTHFFSFLLLQRAGDGPLCIFNDDLCAQKCGSLERASVEVCYSAVLCVAVCHSVLQ